MTQKKFSSLVISKTLFKIFKSNLMELKIDLSHKILPPILSVVPNLILVTFGSCLFIDIRSKTSFYYILQSNFEWF